MQFQPLLCETLTNFAHHGILCNKILYFIKTRMRGYKHTLIYMDLSQKLAQNTFLTPGKTLMVQCKNK